MDQRAHQLPGAQAGQNVRHVLQAGALAPVIAQHLPVAGADHEHPEVGPALPCAFSQTLLVVGFVSRAT
jgi:hypothetical protein